MEDSKKEYSAIEIEIAKKLIEKGYKWIARDKNDTVYVYAAKPIKEEDEWVRGENWSLLMTGFARGVIPIFDGISPRHRAADPDGRGEGVAADGGQAVPRQAENGRGA